MLEELLRTTDLPVAVRSDILPPIIGTGRTAIKVEEDTTFRAVREGVNTKGVVFYGDIGLLPTQVLNKCIIVEG